MTVRKGLLLTAALAAADQALKAALRAEDFILLPNVLRIRGTRNTGAAFSLLRDHPALLAAVSAALLLFVLLLARKERGVKGLCLWAVAGGALGNLIDRLLRGCVIDYIEPLFINFAVFNFADILITCGLCLYAALTLFQKEGAR